MSSCGVILLEDGCWLVMAKEKDESVQISSTLVCEIVYGSNQYCGMAHRATVTPILAWIPDCQCSTEGPKANDDWVEDGC